MGRGGVGDDIISFRITQGDFGSPQVNRAWGGAGDDTLRGGDGDERLFGGSGDDYIAAGAGENLVAGGGGADMFVFLESAGETTIRDFNAEQGDTLWFHQQEQVAGMTGAEIVAAFGTIEDGMVSELVFDFGTILFGRDVAQDALADAIGFHA